MWKVKEKREKRKCLCFGVYSPAGRRRPSLPAGRAPRCYTKLEEKEPGYSLDTGRKRYKCCVAAGADGARQYVDAGASSWAQVVVLLMFKQRLALAAAPSAWPWRELRQWLCLEKCSQGPAAPTNGSWLKPKLSNVGLPSSPASLKYLWAPGLGGRWGPWWEQDVFGRLKRQGASWASLPHPLGVWVQSSCLANNLRIPALTTLLANTMLKQASAGAGFLEEN